MKKCVIHIGMFKTGSSSIQKTFWKQLDTPKWKYLNLGAANHGGVLSTLLSETPPRRHILSGKIDQETFFKKKQRLKRKFILELGSKSENLLISAEWLSSNAFGQSELTEFRNLLADHTDTIEVVGYIRPPKGYMESSFQEKVKLGSGKKLVLDSLYPDYRSRIEKFDNVFGEAQVSLWKFAPATFPNGCVVEDFCGRLGIDFPVPSIKRINESLSRNAVAFLYTYARHGQGIPAGKQGDKEKKLLTERLSKMEGSKMQFAWPPVLSVLKEHQNDIAWMENRLGESLKEQFHEQNNPIRFEKDLFSYNPEDLEWLAKQLGSEFETRWHPNMKPRKVAEWIHTLRLKLALEAGILT